MTKEVTTTVDYCKNCGTELPEGAAYCPKCGTPIETQPEIRLAFWGQRFVAWLIDIIIIGIIIAIIRLFTWIAWPSYTWLPTSAIPPWIPFVDFGTSNVLYFAYWTLTEGIYGQSIGKMAMGIRVTRLDGKPAGLSRAALESFGKAFILLIDLIIGLILHPAKRQRIFNYLSGTIVVRTRH